MSNDKYNIEKNDRDISHSNSGASTEIEHVTEFNDISMSPEPGNNTAYVDNEYHNVTSKPSVSNSENYLTCKKPDSVVDVDLKYAKGKLRKYSWNFDCLLISVICAALVLLAYTISKLVIGGVYFTACQLAPHLPVYLIVDACSTCMIFALPYIYTRSPSPAEKPKHGLWRFPTLFKLGCGISLILFLFHTCWLIYGTILVVETRSTIYTQGHCQNTTTLKAIERCVTCNETLADFTLVIIAVQWVFVGLVTLILGFLGFCIVLSSASKS